MEGNLLSKDSKEKTHHVENTDQNPGYFAEDVP